MKTTSGQRTIGEVALGLVPYGVLLLSVYLSFGHTVDDAYITYRYAHRLVSGHGPVFNPGERVEGFSSPLHLLLSALLLTVAPAVDILFKGKLLSVVCGLIALALLGRTARRCGLSDRGALAAQTLVAANVSFAFASVNGLETTLYASLVLAAAGRFLTELGQPTAGWHRCGSALLLFVALLARPDALLVFAGLLVVRLVRAGWKDAALWAAAFVAPTCLLIALRLAYFGLPLPNTYYAKSVAVGYAIREGLPYLWHGLEPYSRWTQHAQVIKSVVTGHGSLADALLVLSAPLFWGLAAVGFWRVRKSAEGQVCAAVIVALILFVLRSGGDWMSGWRFMIAALPFLAILQVHGLGLVAGRGRAAAWAGAALLWGVCLLAGPHRSWSSAGFSTRGEALMESDTDHNGPFEVAVGNFIRDRLGFCKRIAYSEMGYATFSNLDREFLDTGGLTNRALASAPLRYKVKIGFHDTNWRRRESPLYRVLQQARPDAVIVVAILSEGQVDGPVLGDYRPIPPVGATETVKPGDRVARIYLSPDAYAQWEKTLER